MMQPVFEPAKFGLVHWGSRPHVARGYYITVCEYDQAYESSYSYGVDELETATTEVITCLRCLALIGSDEDAANWLGRQ